MSVLHERPQGGSVAMSKNEVSISLELGVQQYYEYRGRLLVIEATRVYIMKKYTQGLRIPITCENKLSTIVGSITV